MLKLDWYLLVLIVCLKGANASAALMKEIGPDQLPPNERYFGLHNVCQR